MPLFDKKDKSRYATFSRRSLAVGGGMALVFDAEVGVDGLRWDGRLVGEVRSEEIGEAEVLAGIAEFGVEAGVSGGDYGSSFGGELAD